MLVQFSKRLGIGKGGVECIAEAHLFYVPKKPSDYFILNSSAHSGAILIFRMVSALRIADCRSNHDGVTPAAAAARLISASSLLPMIRRAELLTRTERHAGNHSLCPAAQQV